ncbi:MAG: energy-coupling factor ABC transporter permease [Arenicella sp.]
MHIEVGVVNSAKMVLSYGTALGAFAYLGKEMLVAAKEKGILSLIFRSILASLAVLMFFEVFPRQPVGISEVHLILGSTIFLIFGLVPAGIGLVVGLLLQGLLFAPFDLPNYTVNITTLLVPLFFMAASAKKIIPSNTAYKDIRYSQALKLSFMYQGGIVAWVMFWALYGQGFTSTNLVAISSFAAAYMTVVILEPIVDIAVLAGAKALHNLKDSSFVTPRLYHKA